MYSYRSMLQNYELESYATAWRKRINGYGVQGEGIDVVVLVLTVKYWRQVRDVNYWSDAPTRLSGEHELRPTDS